MSLIVTAGASNANSYASVAEVDAYLAARAPFTTEASYTAWAALTAEQKEWRLQLSAGLIDTLRFRGVKATLAQALEFPRLVIGDVLYPRKNGRDSYMAVRLGAVYRENDLTSNLSDDLQDRCPTMEDLEALALGYGVTAPSIPLELKQAQAEVAYQVIHGHLLTLGSMEEGSTGVSGLSVGPLSVQFSTDPALRSAYAMFQSASLDATSVIFILLRRFLTTLRGGLI
jgi:hypothetical protein